MDSTQTTTPDPAAPAPAPTTPAATIKVEAIAPKTPADRRTVTLTSSTPTITLDVVDLQALLTRASQLRVGSGIKSSDELAAVS